MERSGLADDRGAPDAMDALQSLRNAARVSEVRPVKGHVVKAIGTIIYATLPNARIGELCQLHDPATGWQVMAEVVGLSGQQALLTPIGDIHGLSSRTEVISTGRTMQVPVGEGLLGRVIDGSGVPIDGRGPLRVSEKRPLHASAPDPLSRQLVSQPLVLGVRALDGLLTCGEGQRFGIYGEPGAGKSSLVAQIIRGAEVDVAVVALVGERGREVREFIEHNLGEVGLSKSVLVVATSDRPAMERVQAAYVSTAVAEYFRDQGKRVLLIMDSVTRLARALREIGLAAGEPPTRRGFPPSTFAALPKLMERAGPGAAGSITAFYAVLMEGDGTGDPIAEETRGILDGHIVLSRELGAANHFPAIDILASRSRVMNAITSREHQASAAHLRTLLAKYKDVEFLIQVGEYASGNDRLTDEAVAKIESINGFLRQDAKEKTAFMESLEWMKRLVA